MEAVKFPWLQAFELPGNNAVCLKDADDVILWVTRHVCESLGLSQDEVVGKRRQDILDVPNSLEIGRQAIAEQRTIEEVRAVEIRGVPEWYIVNHAPIPPDRTEGHGWCVLVHALDVTAQVRLSATALLFGMGASQARSTEKDEAFTRMLLAGCSVADIAVALEISTDEVAARLARIVGTPIR